MDFNYEKEGFPELLNFDLDKYKPDESKSPEEQAMVNLSPQEHAMQNLVEVT